MTLILSLATPDFVMQVADRQVTYLSNGQAKSNYATKMVMLRNQAILSFTGLAELEGESTDVWLARTIFLAPGSDYRSVFDHIRRRADQAIFREQMRGTPAAHRRLAFVGTGFVRTRPAGPLYPFIARISNFLRGGEVFALPQDTFSVEFVICDRPGSSGLAAAGVPVHDDDLQRVLRAALRRVKHGASFESITAVLCYLIHAVSGQNQYVGRNLLSGFLPRKVSENNKPILFADRHHSAVWLSDGSVFDGQPLRMAIHASFMDLPDGGDPNTQFSPIMSCPGIGAVTITECQGSPTAAGEPQMKMRAEAIAMAAGAEWGTISMLSPAVRLTHDDLRSE
jgi:hypothetical protein